MANCTLCRYVIPIKFGECSQNTAPCEVMLCLCSYLRLRAPRACPCQYAVKEAVIKRNKWWAAIASSYIKCRMIEGDGAWWGIMKDDGEWWTLIEDDRGWWRMMRDGGWWRMMEDYWELWKYMEGDGEWWEMKEDNRSCWRMMEDDRIW